MHVDAGSPALPYQYPTVKQSPRASHHIVPDRTKTAPLGGSPPFEVEVLRSQPCNAGWLSQNMRQAGQPFANHPTRVRSRDTYSFQEVPICSSGINNCLKE